jgi:hypothetical protein
MLPAGYEPAIPTSERQQTHTLQRGHYNRQTSHKLWKSYEKL